MKYPLGTLVPLSEVILKEGELIAENERYVLYDYKVQNTGFSISLTVLKPGKSTRGHRHVNEQFYFFATGTGTMDLEQKLIEVKPLSLIRVESNTFHKINNPNKITLIFVAFPVMRENIRYD